MEYLLTAEELRQMVMHQSDMRSLRRDNELLREALASATDHLNAPPPRYP